MSNPNTGIIYAYRSKTFVGSADWDVPTLFISGDPVGKLRLGGYIPVEVQAGTHHLYVAKSKLGFGKQTEKVVQLPVQVESGSTKFVRYTLLLTDLTVINRVTVANGKHLMELVDPGIGKAEIAETKRSQD